MILTRTLAEILLVGTIAGKSPVATVRSGDAVLALRVGHGVDGWTVLSISAKEVVIAKDRNVRILRTGEYQPEDVRLSREIDVQGNEITVTRDFQRYVGGVGQFTVVNDATATAVPGGYKIWNFDPGSAYDLAGLKNGDVVTAINGVPLTSDAQAIELVSQLQWQDSFTFTVVRDGAERVLRVVVK